MNISLAMLSSVLLIVTDLELEAGAGHDAGSAGDGAGRPLGEGGPQAVDILCTAQHLVQCFQDAPIRFR